VVTRVAHVFRFFVDEAGAGVGARVQLDSFDARHARVLHGARTDERVEVVDGAGALWLASFDGTSGAVVLDEHLGEVEREPRIELLAFVTVGGRTDELVDGAVQAGATRIVPVVASPRDAAKVDARAERLARIATSAAKQAKRAAVPHVEPAIDSDALRGLPAGIVVDPDATTTLDEVVGRDPSSGAVRLLVGASDGFPAGLVEDLCAAAGWQRARLGPAILRSELAAAVAVAVAAMRASRTT
jgi:16S rRNA (uracil1498-N3)-methyltransferase